MKTRIDIEKLLRWAFRDELPKGRPVSASPWDSLMRHGTLGVRIQSSSHGGGDGLGFVFGAPHADAVKVAAAVRDLPEAYKIDAARCRGMLGVYADCDPLAVRAVSAAPFKLSALIVRCAVLNERMPWDCGTPTMRPVMYSSERGGRPHPMILGLDDDGVTLVAVKADRHGRWPLHRAPRGHVEYSEPSIAQLLEMRAEYTAWHSALMMLTRALAGALVDYDATAPVAPASPWFTGDVDVGAVHAVATDAPMSKLPLAPRRKAAGPPLESAIEQETRLNRAASARDRRRAGAPFMPEKRGYSGI
jgi:hypothetical protein